LKNKNKALEAEHADQAFELQQQQMEVQNKDRQLREVNDEIIKQALNNARKNEGATREHERMLQENNQYQEGLALLLAINENLATEI